jgi:hypothetical protein
VKHSKIFWGHNFGFAEAAIAAARGCCWGVGPKEGAVAGEAALPELKCLTDDVDGEKSQPVCMLEFMRMLLL